MNNNRKNALPLEHRIKFVQCDKSVKILLAAFSQTIFSDAFSWMKSFVIDNSLELV